VGESITKTTTLTQEKITEIAGYIRAGNFATVACQVAGVPERTYYHWRECGKEPNSGIYSEFYEAIESAKAALEAQLVARLTHSDSVKAAMWMLERIAPERWGNRRIVVQGSTRAHTTSEDDEEVLTTLTPVWATSEC
jgi:hypothetical protein